MKLTKTQLKKMIVEAIQEEMGSGKNLSTLLQELQTVVKDLDDSVTGEVYAAGNREIRQASDLINQMIKILEEVATTLDQVDPDDGAASDEPMEKIMDMVGVSSGRTTYKPLSYEEFKANKKAGHYKNPPLDKD